MAPKHTVSTERDTTLKAESTNMTNIYPKPIVSIVLPVYNGERYLSEAIESILAQTFPSWELIIVDDCSTDGTPAIIQSYTQKDNRIRYIRNEVNKKLPASLNVGFSHARGQYYTWISDDNRFREDALKIMVDVLDHNSQIDLVYCRVQQIDKEGNLVGPLALPQQSAFLYCTNVILACFLYRRAMHETLGGYDEELFLVEDYDFWLRAYRQFSFKHLKSAPYFYRVHESSLTATRNREIRERAYRIIRREATQPQLGPYKKICAFTGLFFNNVRRRLMLRNHTEPTD